MIRNWGRIWIIILTALCLTGCSRATSTPIPVSVSISPPTSEMAQPTLTRTSAVIPSPDLTTSSAQSLTPTTKSPIPVFSRIIIILFENKEFGSVIGNHQMPAYNRLAEQFTLLTAYYGLQHPSLPNYLALTAGQTFGINTNCETCFVDAANLATQIEKSDRTWKDYQEDMPKTCFDKSTTNYAVKHNPFIYFNDIRLDSARCEEHIVPLPQLESDIAVNNLPNFIWITPNMCHSAHDCGLDQTDAWIADWLPRLMASPVYDDQTMIILTWDEGQGNHGCCGYDPGGGRVPTVLISPLVKAGFQDDTPYTHYSLLKTIELSWGLDLLEHAGDPNTTAITAPFK